MGHLHRQALVQRAKARDALIADGAPVESAKTAVESLSLSSVGDLRAAPGGIHIGADAPKASPAPSVKKAARSKGRKRGTKKKA